MPDDQPLDPQAAAAYRAGAPADDDRERDHLPRARRRAGRHRLPPFQAGGSAPAAPANIAAPLPAGAKVLSSAVGEGHIVLTVEIDGAIELRSFDLNTLKPLGRAAARPKP